MNADDFLPDAATVIAIEADIANYNERRLHAQREIGRRQPIMLGAYALGCAVFFYFVMANFSSLPEQLAYFLLIGGGIGAVFGAVFVNQYARQVGVDTQQHFRNHILPVLFGFVEGLRYAHGSEPGSFSRLPDAMKGNFNQKSFGDLVTGRLKGKRFEIYEATLSHQSKNSSTIVFRGLVLCCSLLGDFSGTLVAVRRPPSGLRQSFDALMRSVNAMIGRDRMVTVISRSRLDNTYEFRTDRPEEARPLLSGRFGEVLKWVDQTWRRGSPRLAVRRSELFVMLPSEKDFFELPPLDRPVSYRAHLEPMVKDFASLLAIVEEVQRGSVPPQPEDVAEEEAAAEETPAAPEEPFVRLLDDVPPAARDE